VQLRPSQSEQVEGVGELEQEAEGKLEKSGVGVTATVVLPAEPA